MPSIWQLCDPHSRLPSSPDLDTPPMSTSSRGLLLLLASYAPLVSPGCVGVDCPRSRRAVFTTGEAGVRSTRFRGGSDGGGPPGQWGAQPPGQWGAPPAQGAGAGSGGSPYGAPPDTGSGGSHYPSWLQTASQPQQPIDDKVNVYGIPPSYPPYDGGAGMYGAPASPYGSDP